METNQKWSELGVRDKFQLINASALIASAIILYFVCFIVTLTIGMGVISAGGTLLATGLALFGVGSYFKNQLVNFETNLEKEVDKQIKRHFEGEKKDEEQ